MKEIKDLAEKADKFLRTAEHALDIRDYDSCVSRCYYAMFFTAEAVLLTEGFSASSHKWFVSELTREKCKNSKQLFSACPKIVWRSCNDAQ